MQREDEKPWEGFKRKRQEVKRKVREAKEKVNER